MKQLPPLALQVEQVRDLIQILSLNSYNPEHCSFLLRQLKHNIIPGLDETSKLKADFLQKVCAHKLTCGIVSPKEAIKLLGTMQGGYNVSVLTDLLDHPQYQHHAYMQLKNTLLIFDSFHDIEEKYKKDKNIYAEKLLYSWSKDEWFKNKPLIPEKVTLCVFKVPGETNIDDLSPDQDAWSRHDIPLHALSMLKTPREGIVPNVNYDIGPIDQIQTLKDSGFPIAYVGDVVGTGSNRKSATNSIQWHFGKDIPYVPNKKTGGYCFGSEIAPIFYNTMEDSGALPIEMDVTGLYTGQLIDLYVHKGITVDHNTGNTLCRWSLKQENLLDSVTAGGRIPLMISKNLTTNAQQALNNTSSSIFISNVK